MRIAIDMQGAQTASRFRGIGRYSMAIVQAMIRHKGEHQIILVLNGLIADSLEAVRASFLGKLPPEDLRTWTAPAPVNATDEKNSWREDVAELLREAFIASLQPDAVFVTSALEGYVDQAVMSVGRLASNAVVGAIVYDLIPLLNRKQYLEPHPRYARYYAGKLGNLQKSDVLLAISEASRREAVEHLGIHESRIHNISAACDEQFRRMHLESADVHELLEPLGIVRPFVLYTGGADERKNLLRLVRAFASMDAGVRDGHQLVFAGRLSEDQQQELLAEARACRLEKSDLLFTGFVTDEELARLYNLCRLFVFPSWHEGFGLPPLEAMSCGAPVIAARGSSLDEVMGWDEAQFDPRDEKCISHAMQHALTDEAFRERLTAHGLRQCQRFSWDLCAQSAIRHLEQAVQQRRQPGRGEPTGNVGSDTPYPALIDAIADALLKYPEIGDPEISAVAACMAENEMQA